LLTIYLACLVEQNDKNELYYISHQLVEAKPSSSISWYAVGCYYLLIGKYDHSRHYFRRCTSIEGSFGEGWLGYAHAFALQGEHDQAMAAYRTSARMISNCHLPSLCIAMEYLRVNNLSLALKFVENARQICPKDPLIYNEMGVVHYKNETYAEALECFKEVFQIVGEKEIRRRVEWESTLFNVGQVHRKLRNYPEALKYFFLCLTLKPNNASTLSAIGLTYHLSNSMDKVISFFSSSLFPLLLFLFLFFSQAIEYYHLSLGRKADDAFTNDMLKRALEDEFDMDFK
jgi:anaphase-promoting complex subunit 6